MTLTYPVSPPTTFSSSICINIRNSEVLVNISCSSSHQFIVQQSILQHPIQSRLTDHIIWYQVQDIIPSLSSWIHSTIISIALHLSWSIILYHPVNSLSTKYHLSARFLVINSSRLKQISIDYLSQQSLRFILYFKAGYLSYDRLHHRLFDLSLPCHLIKTFI